MSRAASHPVADLSIRTARTDDAPAIARLWHEGWRDAHLGRVPDALLRHRDAVSFERRAGDRLGDVTIAQSEGALAGFVRVKDDELEQLFVDRSFRGGAVAPALMRSGEAVLAARGVDRAFLVVNPQNARAIAFYEKTGWAGMGLVDYDAETAEGSFTMAILRMEKSLDPKEAGA